MEGFDYPACVTSWGPGSTKCNRSQENAMRTPLLLSLVGLLSLHPMSAVAQSEKPERYPERPVRVIVPYVAGAAADVIGRIVSQKLSEHTGTQFYVENLPGAGSVTGTVAASRAPADGYTILVMNQDFVVQPLVKSTAPYDPFKSFVPVASIAAAPETISVHPSVPVKGMMDLITLMKANPGKYSYASPGYGTSPHIAVERLFKLTYGLDMVQVPFQGGAPAVTATLAGHTQIVHITLPLVASYINEGKLRGLAVADTKRSRLLPDVPTLTEAGIPKHEVGYWTGIMAPAGTPDKIVNLLNREITKIISAPDTQERLAKMGFDPTPGTSASFADHIRAESAEWGRVVRQANIKID
jgi:tripartite-type tricarboxylate transporter receptor subunit TctC